MKKSLVGIVMGSQSDMLTMLESARVLDSFKIPYEIVISSAHRTPQRTMQYAKSARTKGLKVIIAGAGGAAHLAGVLAAHTTLPVIAVPMASSPLKGLDSFLSTLQMPSGVPVATMGIGKSGAKNAGILAAEILATSSPGLGKRLARHKRQLAAKTAKTSRRRKR